MVNNKLTKIVSESIPFCKVKVIFKYLLYYIEKTKRHFKKQVSEHMRTSALKCKVLKGQQSIAVTDHILNCDHVVKSDDFNLMTRDNSDYFLQIKESLFIGRDDPSLNMTIKSVPLNRF